MAADTADDPDLLYEDLFEDLEDGKAIIKTSIHELEDEMKIMRNETEELKVQLHNLREQNDGLSKQNEILIRNISCLFKTAQMEIARKDKQIRSLQERSFKSNASNCVSPASTSSIRAAAGRDKPYFSTAASQLDQKGRIGEACATSGGMGKQGIHGGKHGEHLTMKSRADTKDNAGEASLHSCSMGKQSVRSEFVDMASPKDCRSRMDSNGARNGGHSSRHGDNDCVRLQRDYKGDMDGTSLASDDKSWKRRRREGGVCSNRGHEYHRGRTEERS